jgi:hypothetical protein
VRGEDILSVLQDVEWVVGSFVANSAGELLLYQMPPEFGEEELKRTTVRLASIVRCAQLCDLGVEQCDFSLNRYQLSMTQFRGGFLCVMLEAPVNKRALEMATRIAVESLPQLVEALEARTPRAANDDEAAPRPNAERVPTPIPFAPDRESDDEGTSPTNQFEPLDDITSDPEATRSNGPVVRRPGEDEPS